MIIGALADYADCHGIASRQVLANSTAHTQHLIVHVGSNNKYFHGRRSPYNTHISLIIDPPNTLTGPSTP
jgi:hypothetical protein